MSQEESKASQKEPKARQEEPKASQEEPKANQAEPKVSQEEPTASHEEPKANIFNRRSAENIRRIDICTSGKHTFVRRANEHLYVNKTQ